MSICNSACVSEIPCIAGAGCSPTLRSAGIDRIIFRNCDVVFDDITDLEEWATLIAQGKIGFTGQILGQKPKASYTRKKIASCLPEQVTGRTYQIQWTDPNADNASFGDYDFYDYIDQNINNLIMSYYTCDGLLYDGITRMSIEVDDVRVEDSDEEMVFDAAVEYKRNGILKPILLPNLSSVLVCQSGNGEGEGEGEGEG